MLQKGQVDEAIIHFRKALAIQPDYGEAHNNLGSALHQKGQVEEAIVHFKEALAINPGDAGAHCNLGNTLLQNGQVDEAITNFQQALTIQPEYALAHSGLGNALLQNGQVDEAIAHLQKTLAIEPGYAIARNRLGYALLQKGQVEEAIVQLQKALAIQPGFLDAQRNLAEIAWRLATRPDPSVRNGVKAVELAQQTDQLSGGKNPVMAGTLAAAYAESGRFPEAVAAAQRAFQLATGQNNAALASVVEAQLKLYQAGSPLRDQ